jgi:hypothetical protein
MKMVSTRHINGMPVQVTDFIEGDGWCVELVRNARTRELALALYEGEGTPIRVGREITCAGKVLIPPEQNQVLQHVRFTDTSSDELLPVNDLLQMIDSLLVRCLDLEDENRFLLACFVMSTWVIDRLPIAPYMADRKSVV